MSVTAETSQDLIGPCGPLEQSVGDHRRHCTRENWSSDLDSGAHPVVGHYRLIVTTMIRVRNRVRVTLVLGSKVWSVLVAVGVPFAVVYS